MATSALAEVLDDLISIEEAKSAALVRSDARALQQLLGRQRALMESLDLSLIDRQDLGDRLQRLEQLHRSNRSLLQLGLYLVQNSLNLLMGALAGPTYNQYGLTPRPEPGGLNVNRRI